MIKNKLGIKFNCSPVHDKKHLKNEVKEYDGVIKTNFLGNDVPKENKHYTTIACITIDSVMRMDKNNYPQVYLKECKYKIKKTQISRFINPELYSDSDDYIQMIILTMSLIMILITILIMILMTILIMILIMVTSEYYILTY